MAPPETTSEIQSDGQSDQHRRTDDDVVLPRHVRSKVLEFDEYPKLEPYTYAPLRNMKKRIRLLKLFSNHLDVSVIDCELFEVEFDDKYIPRRVQEEKPTEESVEYKALSWSWGTDPADHGIRVRFQGHWQRIKVKRELALALKYLRSSRKDMIVWIDAICINQDNPAERNHQVQMMAMIYTRATKVWIWLGEDDNESEKAIRFIRDKITHLERFDELCRDETNADNWQALQSLMQRRWFRRRWVVQEVALARKATIFCGADKISWRDFAVAVELFVEVESATHRLSEVVQKDARFYNVPNWFEYVSELGASLLVNATAKVFRTMELEGDLLNRSRPGGFMPPQQAKVTGRDAQQSKDKPPDKGTREVTVDPLGRRGLLSLEYLVSTMSAFEALEPRDAIYSLLAIARDTSPFAETNIYSSDKSDDTLVLETLSSFLQRKPYKVDYRLPYSDVCKDFISFCITRSQPHDPTRALDIICRPWAPYSSPRNPVTDKGLERKSKVEDSSLEASGTQNKKKKRNRKGVFRERRSTDPVISPGDEDSDTETDTRMRIRLYPPGLPDVPASQKLDKESKRSAYIRTSEAKERHEQERTETPGTWSKESSSWTSHQRLHRAKVEWDKTKEKRQHTGEIMPDFDPLTVKRTDRRNEDTVYKVDDKSTEAYWRDMKQPDMSQPVEDKLGSDNEIETSTSAGLNSDGSGKSGNLNEVEERLRKQEAKRSEEEKARRSAAKVWMHFPGTWKGKPGKEIEPWTPEFREPDTDIDLPSWVGSIEGAPFGLHRFPGMHIVRTGRKNADPLVGLPEDRHRNYSAAQTQKAPELRFCKRPRLGHYSLYVKGFILDRVEEVAAPAYGGNIPKAWTTVAGWDHQSEVPPPDEFVRTLVADRGANNRNPPYYYTKACFESMRKGSIESGRVNIEQLINNEQNSIITEFCRRVQGVIWNRCLIRTTHGRLGLVNDTVKKNDLVCIIYGCSVPVILRKCSKLEHLDHPQSLDSITKNVDGQNGNTTHQLGGAESDVQRQVHAFSETFKQMRVLEQQISEAQEDDYRAESLTKLAEVKERLSGLFDRTFVDLPLQTSRSAEREVFQKKLEIRLAEEKHEDRVNKLTAFIRRCEHRFVQRARYEELKRDGFKRHDPDLTGDKYRSQIEDVTSKVNEYLQKKKKVEETARANLEKLISDVKNPPRNKATDPSAEKLQDWELDFNDEHYFYKVMGESYIHGMMDGDAIREQFRRDIKPREFELR